MKLEETRMQQLLEAERVRLAQPALWQKLEAATTDASLVPGRALATGSLGGGAALEAFVAATGEN